MAATGNRATSAKQLAIIKANSQMIIVVAVASFITVFSLIAGHALWSQEGYQSRVITQKQKAVQQLKTNVQTVSKLVNSYKVFVSLNPNAIGGNPNGTGPSDGDNAKVVLDALPSKYDFPALTSSLEEILQSQHVTINSLTGTDDEVAQSSEQTSNDPQPVAMPFGFTVKGTNYIGMQNLIAALQLSIRPIQIDTLSLSGASSNMQLTITAHTYYQPEKDLKITTEVVK